MSVRFLFFSGVLLVGWTANAHVFSSITHLGSNPALLHFTLRPNTVPRDTYKNIRENCVFTVNHVSLAHLSLIHI